MTRDVVSHLSRDRGHPVTKQHVRYLTILFDNDTMMSIRSNTDPRVLRQRMVGARSPMTRDKVVLAYSGGLDTSVAIRWLQDRGLDVVALTIDVGQPGDLQGIKEKAQRLGAKAHIVDARQEFADRFILPALQANAMYEGQYPLST